MKKGLKFVLMNIRSLVSKIGLLVDLFSNNKIDVLCLNETFCDDSITNEELLINGLCIERKDRTRSGGGVAVYISTTLHYVRRKEFENVDLELICLQIYLPFQKDMLLFCVYRPPGYDLSFVEKFRQIIESVHSTGENTNEILILGDLNCNFLEKVNTSLFSKMMFLMNLYNFQQLIDTPTRVTHQSSTLIDTIFTTKNENIIEHGCIHTSLSDHFSVYAIRRIKSLNKCPTQKGKVIKYRLNKQENMTELLCILQTTSWSHLDEVIDANVYWKVWKDTFV